MIQIGEEILINLMDNHYYKIKIDDSQKDGVVKFFPVIGINFFSATTKHLYISPSDYRETEDGIAKMSQDTYEALKPIRKV